MININNANIDRMVHEQKANSSCNTPATTQALRSAVAAGLEETSSVSMLQGLCSVFFQLHKERQEAGLLNPSYPTPTPSFHH